MNSSLCFSDFLCTHRENMPSHFKFKEYCPLVFRNLRERFGIDDQDFLVKKKKTSTICSIRLV